MQKSEKTFPTTIDRTKIIATEKFTENLHFSNDARAEGVSHLNTRPRASSQLEREVTAKLSASDTSCAVRLAHVRAMSSANCSDDAGADSEGISLVYMENSMGPSTEPCGTPQVHPRATAAFGSRHLRFRWISSHLGVQ